MNELLEDQRIKIRSSIELSIDIHTNCSNYLYGYIWRSNYFFKEHCWIFEQHNSEYNF